jgi:hypothetical protein
MDLVRAILFKLEEQGEPEARMDLTLPPYTPDQIAYHAKIMQEAGLIETEESGGVGQFRVYPTRLTWEGHEFLEAAREDTRWNAAKRKVGEVAGGVTLQTWKDLLTQQLRSELGLG